MPSERTRVKLSDLIRVKHGFAFKGEHFVDEPTSHVLVTPGNFAIGGGFQDTKLKFYRGPVPEEYILKPGDLVVTMTDLSRGADTLGFGAVVPNHQNRVYLHNQRVGLVEVLQASKVTPRWLHYLLRTDEYRAWVVGSASGSTVKHTSPSRICDFEFELPNVNVQQEAAETLDALENRIDLLRQTNATLESIAQALFKSWFIDFDPVRARAEGREPEGMDAATAALFPAEFEESALGLIPKGWRAVTLADAVEVNPSRSLFKGADAPYLEMANAPTSGHRPVQAVDRRAFGSGCKFRNGDALMAKITPCLENGKGAFVDFLDGEQVGWGSTEFIVLRSKPTMPTYGSYLLSRHEPFRQYAIQAMTGTSGRQRVELSRLNQFLIAVPPSRAVADAANSALDALQMRIAANAEQASTLAQFRDALLPRLISGKLRLPEAQEQVEEAVA